MLATLATLAALAALQQLDTTVVVRPGTALEVTNPSGSIVVKATSQNAVHVHVDDAERDALEISLEGATLRIKPVGRGGPVFHAISLVITAPAWMGVTLSGVNTDIDVDGAQGAVSVETVNGHVACRGGRGFVSLKSVDGAIELQQASGRVEANTVSDDVSLEHVSGDITAASVSGDIELKSIDSPSVEAATVSGDVSYDGAIRDTGHYRFTTHNGDVTIRIPEKVNATVSVSTFSGDFDSSFPVTLTGTSKHRFSFTLGSGSAHIDLDTFNGDIEVRHPSDQDKDPE